jgi:hypothetical protein
MHCRARLVERGMLRRTTQTGNSLRHGNFLFRIAVLAGLICGMRPFEVRAQHMIAPASSTAAEAVRSNPSTIVIGFMGGMVKRDKPNRSEVRLAAKLRDDYSNLAYVDTYENARWKDARAKIIALLDTNRDGKLSAEEKERARIILFGHSWGASTAVTLARDLRELGIPVLLTVQVDSVQKMGQKDDVIPANVAEAMNFFQSDGMLHGRKLIRAENPEKTKILGNYEFSYKHTSLSCKGYAWQQKVFAKEHMYIECDPQVWSKIESLIRSKLPPTETEAHGN